LITLMEAKQKLKRVQIEAVVIRADGTREDLGIISYWHKNPWKRLLWKARHWRKHG